MRDDSAEIFFHFFLLLFFCRRPVWAVLTWAGSPLFDVVHPAFPLPTMASPTLQGAVKNGLERVTLQVSVSRHLPEEVPAGQQGS